MGECQEVADERCRANEHDTYEHVIELGLQYYKQSCGQVHPNKETVELAAEEEDKKATDDAGNFGTDNPSEHELDDDENLEDM